MNTNALISFAVTAKLICVGICVFVFASTKCWFSHNMAQILQSLVFFDKESKTRKQRRRSRRRSASRKVISAFVFITWVVQSLYFLIRNFKPLAIFCSCTFCFVSDKIGNQNDGQFQMVRLISVAQTKALLFIEINM